MPRKRSPLIGWTYDDECQEIRTPSGRVITLMSVAQRLQDDIACRFDFLEAWNGWKMRGGKLYPPHSGRNGPALTPNTAPMFANWINEAVKPHNGQNKQPGDRPRLWLAYSENRRR